MATWEKDTFIWNSRVIMKNIILCKGKQLTVKKLSRNDEKYSW